MPQKSLVDMVTRLSPDKQAAVRDFVEFIEGRGRESEESPYRRATEEFIAAHPELLRLLAQ